MSVCLHRGGGVYIPIKPNWSTLSDKCPHLLFKSPQIYTSLSLGVDLLSSFDAINKEHKLWKVSDQSHTSNTDYPTKGFKTPETRKKHDRHIADHLKYIHDTKLCQVYLGDC